jgi:hypothetical protein
MQAGDSKSFQQILKEIDCSQEVRAFNCLFCRERFIRASEREVNPKQRALDNRSSLHLNYLHSKEKKEKKEIGLKVQSFI